MGFDLLLIGIILLANPFYVATDLIAAVIISVAVKGGEEMLRGFKKARLFSYGLMAIGAAEIAFKYIFPNQTALGIFEVWRYGLLIPIAIYVSAGIADYALITENASLYRRTESVKNPIYVTFIAAAIAKAAATAFPTIEMLGFLMSIAASTVLVILATVVYKCKASGGELQDDENYENDDENMS